MSAIVLAKSRAAELVLSRRKARVRRDERVAKSWSVGSMEKHSMPGGSWLFMPHFSNGKTMSFIIPRVQLEQAKDPFALLLEVFKAQMMRAEFKPEWITAAIQSLIFAEGA